MVEARGRRRQTDYNLQAPIGAQEIASGDPWTALGLPPGTQFRVQNISELSIPDAFTETANNAVDHAFEHRPE